MNWIETTVGVYCPFVYGKGLPKTKRAKGAVPVYGSNGRVDYHSKSYTSGPGIVIGRKGSVGAIHLSEVPFWPIDTSFYLEKDSLNELKFTYHLLKSLGLEGMNSDSAVPGLKRENAHSISIYIPELKEDREHLGEWISKFDDKIELNRQINQTLEEMAQAVFKSWFVDFEPTRAKIRARENGQDPTRAAMAAIAGKTVDQLDTLTPDQIETLTATADLFPDQLILSDLGEIPQGWKLKNIGDIVDRLKPKKRYTKKQVERYGSVPVLEQGASILMGYHNDEAGFLASPENPLFIFGDHTCVVHLSCENFDISSNVIPLMGKGYPTIWVYYAIQGKQEFQEYRRHWSEFVVKDVVVPCADLTTTYSLFVTSLYKQKEQSTRETKTLEQLRDSLLPKLLSGEIDISDLVEAGR